MKKRKMDYQRIIDVCKIIGVILTVTATLVAVIGVWAYFKNKEVKKIENEIEENRTVKIEEDISVVKNDLINIKDEVVEEVLRKILDERQQISKKYDDLPKEEQDQILRDRFKLSSEEIDSLIEKAIKRTESYLSQAMGYELKYDYNNAVKFYEMALGETSIYSQKAWILSSLGNIHLDTKNHLKAINYYERSLNNYNKVGSKNESEFLVLGNIYSCLGIIYRGQKKYKEAIGNHEKALKIREDLVVKDYNEYIFDLSKSYNDLAVVYKDKGDIDKSINYNELAIKVRKELFSKSNNLAIKYYIARSLSNLGNAYFDKAENLKASGGDYLKNYNKAKKSIEEAIELITSLKGKIDEVKYQGNLASFNINYGRVLHSLKDYKNSVIPLKEAIDSYKKLIQVNEEMYIEPYVGAIINLARTYRDTDKLDESIQMFYSAIEIQTKIVNNRKLSGDSEMHLADIYFNLGVVYFENGPNKELALLNFNNANGIYVKYPQSAYAQKWSQAALERINFLSGI